ncbi:hypothetical protein ABPG75_001362 [Micractinium tetrahymenae]
MMATVTPARAAPAPFRASSGRRTAALRSKASQGQENGSGGGPVVSEDVLARLREAEEEAARLKKELAAAQAAASAAGLEAAAEDADKQASRIDGGDLRRETLFSGVESKQRNWLSESDVAFFTGGGPGEAGGEGVSQEDQEVVKRRLVLGLVAAAGLGAFALVPTQELQLAKPSKPLFFYLVPLLRSQQLLVEAERLVPEGDLLALQSLLRRILGEPNSLQQNLRDAAACLPNTRDAERAAAVGREVYEYVLQIDYDQYFETMSGARRDGRTQQQYYEFSLNSARAAQAKLREFLALMPADQREAAATQLASLPF